MGGRVFFALGGKAAARGEDVGRFSSVGRLTDRPVCGDRGERGEEELEVRRRKVFEGDLESERRSWARVEVDSVRRRWQMPPAPSWCGDHVVAITAIASASSLRPHGVQLVARSSVCGCWPEGPGVVEFVCAQTRLPRLVCLGWVSRDEDGWDRNEDSRKVGEQKNEVKMTRRWVQRDRIE